jgi:hypothetical protein
MGFEKSMKCLDRFIVSTSEFADEDGFLYAYASRRIDCALNGAGLWSENPKIISFGRI